jgi:hypothetical protein
VPKPLVLASTLVLGLDYPERGDDSSPERRTAEAETGRWGGGGGEQDLGRRRRKNEEIGGGARLGRVLDHGLQFCLVRAPRKEIPNLPLRVEIFSMTRRQVWPNEIHPQ